GRCPPRGARAGGRLHRSHGGMRGALAEVWGGEEARMHQIFFVAKRAHWGCQNRMRKPLKKKFDITAGRVDMLHAISKESWPQGREQRRLATKLGCVRSVVSRMLKAMEKLGWIHREKPEYDRRMWL